MPVKVLEASKQIEVLDVAIKAASEAHKLPQWGDVLTEACDHADSRPDFEGRA